MNVFQIGPLHNKIGTFDSFSHVIFKYCKNISFIYSFISSECKNSFKFIKLHGNYFIFNEVNIIYKSNKDFIFPQKKQKYSENIIYIYMYYIIYCIYIYITLLCIVLVKISFS